MKIPFAFRRLTLVPGATFAVTAPRGGRVRVLSGRIWAASGGELDDVWLQAGEEHLVGKRNLTVIESIGAATVELVPPFVIGAGRARSTDYRSEVPRRLCGIAALAMALFSFATLVILPATVGTTTRVSADAIATTPAPEVAARDVAARKAPRS